MNAQVLKSRLSRTWGAFFGRHGNFTPIQLKAIPFLLDGHNVLLHAGTASGKTEAALAPLIERHLPVVRPAECLTLLYVLPTRALISDVSSRLAVPLDTLRITWAVKTHDDNTFSLRHPTDVLLTTPESFDSLLASQPRALIHVRAVLVDELHTFDASVRGDQLRVLLRRLRALRTYAVANADTDGDTVQFAALSATLAQPELSAARYFPDAQIASAAASRSLHIETIALEDADPRALSVFLSGFRARGWKKALAFCNTRTEVERYAACTRSMQSPFSGSVYVHYSNLDRERRREIEAQFSQAEAAICFASSTLELGIDIGSIDVVLLIGPPGSAEAFAQRIGRASRRTKTARAACFYRNPLERRLFDALTHSADLFTTPTPFRPGVMIQQIFSLLKASPTGGIRLSPLAALMEGLLARSELELILGELQEQGYLKVGHPGEWRPGERLNHLIDLQSSERVSLSIYSNLHINADTLKIRDRHSQRVVAVMDRLMSNSGELLLEGRKLNVEWMDGDSLWVSAARDTPSPARAIYRSARPVLSYDLARALLPALGLGSTQAPLIPVEEGWLWFHFMGDIYGQALFDLLSYTLPCEVSEHPGLCIVLMTEIDSLPTWLASDIRRYLLDHYRAYERMLDLGAYHTMLPSALRRQTVVEQFNVPRFMDTVRHLTINRPSETAAESLHVLMQKTGDTE